jgi:MtN3 and saliva related transmembrane protein
MSLETLIGTIAATGTTACWLPQVVKTIRTRSANDFSWSYLAMLITGVALWVVYGVMRHDMVVLGANAATLLLVVIVAAVKLRAHF